MEAKSRVAVAVLIADGLPSSTCGSPQRAPRSGRAPGVPAAQAGRRSPPARETTWPSTPLALVLVIGEGKRSSDTPVQGNLEDRHGLAADPLVERHIISCED